MKKIFLIITLFVLSTSTFAQAGKKKPTVNKRPIGKTAMASTAGIPKDGLFANIETSKGAILILLEHVQTPVTVANFVSLAEGKNTFVKADLKGKPFYNGLKFHRVIKDFMIQGGDPLGTGSGDPGYKFKDEFTNLIHDKPGILSMANSGPGTNGSQFFITHKATPWLNGKHTIFGHVITGQNVVDAIAQDDIIKTITIVRKGAAAKAFDAAKIFTAYFGNKDADEMASKAKAIAEAAQAKAAYMATYGSAVTAKLSSLKTLRTSASKTESGLEYVLTKNNGAKPAEGATIYVHYSGFLEDGTLFQSSHEDVSKTYGKFDQQQAAQNGYMPFPFKAGSKTGLIPGFLEGINLMAIGDKITMFIPSKLGYGDRAMGNIIPANSNLIFEVEVFDVLPVKK